MPPATNVMYAILQVLGFGSKDKWLIEMAKRGDLERVRGLVACGANVNFQDKEWYGTPLYYASKYGYINVVKALLDEGADMMLADKTSNTPLHIASNNGHFKVVKELLAHGASVGTTNENNSAALHRASWWGHIVIVKELLIYGASVYSVDENGDMALHCASARGNLEIVKELLANGAGKDRLVTFNETSIYYDTPPRYILSISGGNARISSGEKSSLRNTAVLAAQADGSKLAIMFIFRGVKGGIVDLHELPIYPQCHFHAVQRRAWMDGDIWKRYLRGVVGGEVSE
ncbi:hypothetical protein LEN26_017413 [Aphanomyces euteiches]|nr:hypothetical protein LEN26_017413 [Aphanomyces euteiches]